MDKVKNFLEAEAKWKLQKTIDRRKISAMHPRVPVQQNSTDCGCFLLEYVERFLQDPEKVTSQLSKREDFSSWFSADDAALRRLKLQNEIEALAADYKLHKLAEHPGDMRSASSDIEEIHPDDFIIQ
jgi:Ulp1 family protease